MLVNINPAYRLHELEETLRQADVATLIVGLPFKDSDFVGMVETLCPEVGRAASPRLALGAAARRSAGWSRSATGPGPGWLAWADLEAAPIVAASWPIARRSAAAGDVYNIQFTSGTTGLPKGAMLTHRNVLMNAYYIGQRVRYTADDRVCVPVPFYHCFGCVLGTLVCAVYGSALVVPAPSFDAGATLAAVDAERCTSLYGVPTMFVAELDHPDRARFDLSSLRTGIMAGSPCPLPLMEAVIATMGASRDHDRLRPDRGLADHHADLGRRPDRGPRRHGRPADPGRRGPARRPATRAATSPPARPGELCVRGPRRDGRLLQEPRGDRPRRSTPTAGSTPATSPAAATTATTGSSAAARS